MTHIASFDQAVRQAVASAAQQDYKGPTRVLDFSGGLLLGLLMSRLACVCLGRFQSPS